MLWNFVATENLFIDEVVLDTSLVMSQIKIALAEIKAM